MKQSKLTTEEIGAVCLSLAHLYHAGIGGGDALALMAGDETGQRRELLSAMALQADRGASLAQAFSDAGAFPHYVSSLLEAGERVGRTEETLQALARYYRNRAGMERRLRSTLTYPAVLLAVLLAVVVVLLVRVLPVFNEVYAQLGSRLTGAAGGLLLLGSAIGKALPVLGLLLTVTAAISIALALLPSAREKLGAALRDKRSDRGINRQINAARFAQALSMGLSSGMTGQEAAQMAARLAEGAAFRERCAQLLRRLDSGEALAFALRETDLLSKADCRLLDSGLRSGQSEIVMEQIAARLLEESEDALEARAARVEPTLVVVMSSIVGAILLSVMLPLMHIMTSIG